MVYISYLVHYDTLLQNPRDIITKCDSYFIIKCNESLLQDAPGFFYKIAQIYFNFQQFLQNMSILLQKATVFVSETRRRSLKSHSHIPKIFFSICFNDSPSKMMKNVFYFILKALFVLKIFKFLS